VKSSERERIERLSEIFAVAGAGAKAERGPAERGPAERGPAERGPAERSLSEVLVGIGDDCAVLLPGAEPLVWTIDASVEGVHFRRDLLSFEDIGHRATMAAASDLAAMGASPLGVLSALVLPDDVSDADLEAIARGQREAVNAIGTAVLGGNLARGGELSITTTVLGRAPRPLQRRGARPGDALWLIGPVGLAAAGLRLLLEARPVETSAARACVAAWRRPSARIGAGLSLRGVAAAAIDVSDGLARDVGHLARASGVRAVIEIAALDSAELIAVAAELGVVPAELALHGGEDYALAFAAPESAVLQGAVKIGSFEASDAAGGGVAGGGVAGGGVAGGGVVAKYPDGSRKELREGGYDHFAR